MNLNLKIDTPTLWSDFKDMILVSTQFLIIYRKHKKITKKVFEIIDRKRFHGIFSKPFSEINV